MSEHRAEPGPDGIGSRRAWAAVFAVVAVTAVTAGLAPAAMAAPTVPTQASIGVTTSTVEPGGTTTVTGTLGAGAAGVPGVAVVLQQRIAGTTGWRTWRSVATDRAGRITARTGLLTLSRDLRLRFAGTGRYRAASSRSERVTVRQRVTSLEQPAPTAVVRGALRFSGTASAGLSGHLVHLELARGAEWVALVTSQVRADGSFALAGRATAAGPRQYRVRVEGGPGESSVTTFPSLITTSAWYSLQDLDPVDPRGAAPSSVTLAGTSSRSSATFDLAYRCSRLEVPARAGASSPAGERQVVALDGIGAATASTRTGRTSLDLTGSGRLTVPSALVRGAAAPDGGGARILCAGRP